MRTRLIFFMACVLIVGAAHVPFAWIGPKNVPVTYVGTMWDGTVTDIPSFPNVRTNISLLEPLKGKPPVRFRGEAPDLNFEGSVSLGGMLNLNAEGKIGFASRVDQRLAALEGDFDLNLTGLRIRQTCESGKGRVTSDVLMRNERQWQWRGPELSGPITCEQGDIVMSLEGQDPHQTVSAEIRLSLSGRYIITANIETTDARAGTFLPLYGFEKFGNEYRINEQGRWM